VGKTTIQKQIIEELLFIDNVKAKNIFRVQFDDVPALGSLASPVETLVRWYEKTVLGSTVNEAVARGEGVYFFFDEIQNLPAWSSQVKAIADHTRAKILVTGSSALRIAKGKDSLAGRVAQIDLGPLTLTEILGVRRVRNALGDFESAIAEDIVDKDFWHNFIELTEKYRTDIDEAVQYYSDLGGYPICHKATEASPSDLADLLIDGVINKAIDHDPVRLSSKRSVNRHVAKELFRLICRYAGQPLTVTQFSRQIGTALGKGVSSDEINDALAFLEETMLVRRVRQLEMLCRKNDGCCKYCVCDPFVRNSFLGEDIPLDPSELASVDQAVATQAGHLVESCIGNHCSQIPRVDLSWVSQKANTDEIDFILTIGDKRIPIEVKYVSRKIRQSDYEAVSKFALNPHYGAEFGLVATQTLAGELSDNVLAVRALDLLLL